MMTLPFFKRPKDKNKNPRVNPGGYSEFSSVLEIEMYGKGISGTFLQY